MIQTLKIKNIHNTFIYCFIDTTQFCALNPIYYPFIATMNFEVEVSVQTSFEFVHLIGQEYSL